MTNIVAEKRQHFTSTGGGDLFRAFLFFRTLAAGFSHSFLMKKNK
jgi:hypothetical protein